VTPHAAADGTGGKAPFLDPAAGPVAVIGASADRTKYGNAAVRAYVEGGYTVWPVNPKDGRIEGVPTFASVAELPGLPSVASIYLREPAALETLDELARMELRYRGKISVVFLNPGVGTRSVRRRAADLGLAAVHRCSIRAIGRDPKEFGPAFASAPRARTQRP
jgi:predicted CoA-binding protein